MFDSQQSTVDVQPVEIAAYPSENNPLTSEPDQVCLGFVYFTPYIQR